MAGDWIKMRSNLWDDPRVAKLCDLTGQSEAAIVGGLYWLWATADQHTEDGCMPGLTLRQIDRKTGIQGFGAGLCAIGWLVDDEQGVVLARFDEHNGSSAKRRCTDAQRKASVRSVSASDADKSKTDSGQKAPNLGAREEKRREEGNTSEANASGAGAPPAPADVIFGLGVPLMTAAGVSEKNCRSMLGLMRKTHGDTALITALQQCAAEKPLQPVPWLQAALKAPAGRDPPEPEWRRQQRERNEAFLGPAAARRAKQPEVIDGYVSEVD